MRRAFIDCLGIALFLIVLSGVGVTASPKGWEPGPGAPVVSGSVSMGKARYGEGVSLPGMATLQVELMDTSGKGPHGGILGEETIWLAAGRLPIDFRIPYDPSRIDPTRTYMVRARILDGEKVLFLNTTPVYVLTQGAPSKVDIVVVPAQVRVR